MCMWSCGSYRLSSKLQWIKKGKKNRKKKKESWLTTDFLLPADSKVLRHHTSCRQTQSSVWAFIHLADALISRQGYIKEIGKFNRRLKVTSVHSSRPVMCPYLLNKCLHVIPSFFPAVLLLHLVSLSVDYKSLVHKFVSFKNFKYCTYCTNIQSNWWAFWFFFT